MAKILVIDDELNIRKLAQVNLTASGYQVFMAGNAEEGLKLAGQERPDLILLDVRLPNMSGWDMLFALKTDRKLKKIPVIIMTASPPKPRNYKLHPRSVAGYLLKPFSVDDLLNQVKQVLGE